MEGASPDRWTSNPSRLPQAGRGHWAPLTVLRDGPMRRECWEGGGGALLGRNPLCSHRGCPGNPAVSQEAAGALGSPADSPRGAACDGHGVPKARTHPRLSPRGAKAWGTEDGRGRGLLRVGRESCAVSSGSGGCRDQRPAGCTGCWSQKTEPRRVPRGRDGGGTLSSGEATKHGAASE